MDQSAALVLPPKPGISHGEPRQDLDIAGVCLPRFLEPLEGGRILADVDGGLPRPEIPRIAVPGGGTEADRLLDMSNRLMGETCLDLGAAERRMRLCEMGIHDKDVLHGRNRSIGITF